MKIPTPPQDFHDDPDPIAYEQYAALAAAAEAKEHDPPQVINQFKCRAFLDGMNAGPEIRAKRDALLGLLTKEDLPLPPPTKTFFGFRLERGQMAYRIAIEEVTARRERILWSIIGELSLELSKVNGSLAAAEIQADAGRDVIRMQKAYSKFRSFFLEHFPQHIARNETTGRDLYDLAMEIMLAQKS